MGPSGGRGDHGRARAGQVSFPARSTSTSAACLSAHRGGCGDDPLLVPRCPAHQLVELLDLHQILPASCISIAARKRPSRLPRTPLEDEAKRAGCRSNEFREEWCDPRNAPNALAPAT
jgi:hypothetical protein